MSPFVLPTGLRRYKSKSEDVRVLILCTLAIALVQVIPGYATPPSSIGDRLGVEHELSLDFETPHTKWAKPYAEGKVRALFFAPWYQGSTDGREIVERMQRFDLQADAVYYLKGASRLLGDNNPRWYGDPQAGTNRLLQLLKNPYDVFFFDRVTLDVLPEAAQSLILDRVRGGAGLVVVGAEEPPLFCTEAGEPDRTEPELGSFYSVGKGRAILLRKRDPLEYSVGWETAFDYQMAQQGRALLWAAGRTPRLALQVTVPEECFAGTQRRAEAVTVNWHAASPGVELRVEVRRWDGHKRLLGTVEASMNLPATFVLPALRAGEYRVEVFATSDRGMENWVTAPFAVLSTRRITAVELDKDWVEVGETFTGRVRFEGDALYERVQIRLTDQYERILATEDFGSVENTPLEFSFEIEPWMPMLLRVEAVTLNWPNEIASAYAFLRVTQRNQEQFNFVVWNYASGDLAPYAAQSMARSGATAILQGGPPPPMLAANELAYVPYTTSFRKSSHTVTAMLDPEGILKGECVHDDVKMEAVVNNVVENSRTARGHGVLVYSLGDENAVRASCLGPHCLQAYREYLQREYETIAALNASWGTGYASFDAITLLEGEALPAENAPRWFKEFFAQRLQKNRTDSEGAGEEQIVLGDKNDELLALQAENYPRWYDRQAFQSYTYVQWCKRFLRAFRKIDPKSLTGFEGTDSFTLRRLTTRSRQGGDLDLFLRELEYFGPYGGPANEVVRSLAPPGFPTGNWIGYSMEADVLLQKYWEQVTNGMNVVQWWRWDCLDGYHGFLSPNLMPFPATQTLLEDTQVVRDGLGTLLMQCEIRTDEIAMLYSMPSTHIAHFDGNRSYGNYKRDHGLWHKTIHEAGLQFRYVTDRMLRLGEFESDRYKVLILPLAFAIGPEEARVIREFVQNGGTLIADVRPGMYDGHCKPLEAGTLDDVFGIERTGKRDTVSLDRMSVNGEIDGHTASMRWGNWEGREIYPQMRVDPTVVTTTGKEMGQAFPIHFWWGLNHPVGIVNEFGEGRAILLNFPIYNAPAQSLVEGILASAGVAPEVTLRKPNGEAPKGVEITRWRNGDIELLALLGTYEGDVTVHLPAARVVCDLKGRTVTGTAEEFATYLRPHRAAFFALLPESAAKPVLELETESTVQGSVLSAGIRVPGAKGKHVIRVSATTPEGRTASWLERTRIVTGERQRIRLPFAHNDPPGQWTVHAVDLYTDQRSSATVTLQRTPLQTRIQD